MRFVDRSSFAEPQIFYSKRAEEARRQLQEFVFQADDKLRSQSRFFFDQELIDGAEVRGALLELFCSVCAYCETPVHAFSDKRLDVATDHFRPRQNASDHRGKSEFIYYAWLAYEWDNLVLACPSCNRAKRNQFPLRDKRRGRIGAPIAELREMERPLLLDPCHSDIAASLSFSPDGSVEGRNEIGDATIRILQLDRSQLVESRLRAFRAYAVALIDHHQRPHVEDTGWGDGWGSHVARFPDLEHGHLGAFALSLRNVLSPLDRKLRDLPDALNLLDRLTGAQKLDVLARYFGSARDFESRYKAVLLEASPKDGLARPYAPSRALDPRALKTANFPIARVSIENFKALKRIEFSLPAVVENPRLAPCMLVLGENATGKSTVLEAITLALIGTDEAQQLDWLLEDEQIEPSAFIHRPDVGNWEVPSKQPLRVEIGFAHCEEKVELSGHAGDDLFEGTPFPSTIVLAYGPRRFFRKKPMRRFRAPAYRVRSLFDPMAVIPNPMQWLLELRDEGRFDAAVRALRSVLMLKADARVLRGENMILVDTPQGSVPMSRLSVGYKSVVAMAIDIIREMFYYFDNLEEARAVVIIDEIETHLHPRWKMQIVSSLREAFPQIQFILTTHDPLCLRGMYQGEVFVLQRNTDDAAVESLQELPDVRGMRAEQILTSEFFGLGSTDPETDARLMRYQFLVRKDELSATEKDEKELLASELKRRMAVGESVEEQAEAVAMRAFTDEREDVPLVLDPDARPGRKAMVEQALAKLRLSVD